VSKQRQVCDISGFVHSVKTQKILRYFRLCTQCQNTENSAIFQASAAVCLRPSLILNVMRLMLVVYRRFGTNYHSHLQGPSRTWCRKPASLSDTPISCAAQAAYQCHECSQLRRRFALEASTVGIIKVTASLQYHRFRGNCYHNIEIFPTVKMEALGFSETFLRTSNFTWKWIVWRYQCRRERYRPVLPFSHWLR
jgi:hypothetical protein